MPWTKRLFPPAALIYSKNRLNKIRMTRMGYFMDWFWLALGLPDALPWKATRGEIPRWDDNTRLSINCLVLSCLVRVGGVDTIGDKSRLSATEISTLFCPVSICSVHGLLSCLSRPSFECATKTCLLTRLHHRQCPTRVYSRPHLVCPLYCWLHLSDWKSWLISTHVRWWHASLWFVSANCCRHLHIKAV